MAKTQIESKVLTVSEIAETAGITRNKVWSFIRRNEIKPVSKKSGKFKFDSKVVLEIENKQQKKRIENNKKEDDAGISNTVLEIFKKQLEKKDQQIKDQAKTIDFLKGEILRARLDNQKKEKLLEDAAHDKEDAHDKIEAVSAQGKIVKNYIGGIGFFEGEGINL